MDLANTFLEVKGNPGQTPPDVIRALADLIEERRYEKADFPQPDWKMMASEERMTRPSLN